MPCASQPSTFRTFVCGTSSDIGGSMVPGTAMYPETAGWRPLHWTWLIGV